MIFQTERLSLRHMSDQDIPLLMEIFSDPVAMKYYPSTKTEEEARSWIDWNIRNYNNFGVGLWIVEDVHTGEFYGQCGITPQQVENQIEMEIGYLFARRAWGNGYATEAAIACRKYGFKIKGYSKLISLILPTNLPSIGVALRNEMQLERYVECKGRTHAVYSIYQR